MTNQKVKVAIEFNYDIKLKQTTLVGYLTFKDLKGRLWQSKIPGEGTTLDVAIGDIAKSTIGSAIVAQHVKRLIKLREEIARLTNEELDKAIEQHNQKAAIPSNSKRETKEQKLFDFLAGA